MTNNYLTVLWLDAQSAGYTDLLPTDWFLEDKAFDKKKHKVRGPDSEISWAKCNVTINGSFAELDYGPFSEFNKKNDILLGIIKIQFKSPDRKQVEQVWWRGERSKNFRKIRTIIRYERSLDLSDVEDIDLLDTSVAEGRKKLVTHLRRERSPKLVAEKKDAVLAEHGVFACEACRFIFKDKYGELGATYCEVHHRKPLAAGEPRKTSLSDLAILCSNCHRMIHKTNPILSVEQFRKKYLVKAAGQCAAS